MTRLKKKNHKSLSIDAEKPFNRIQCLFIIKSLKNRSWSINFSLLRSIYKRKKKRTIANIIFDGERVNVFSFLLRYVFNTLIQHNAGISSQCSKWRKENTSKTDQKGRNKSVLISRWYNCLYRKHKESTNNTSRTKKSVQQVPNIKDKH